MPPQRVSIHAPRVGRDFLNTLTYTDVMVSIHAPRVGRDHLPSLPRSGRRRFNSRAPRGARPTARLSPTAARRFNSRAPRGARRSASPASLSISAFQFTRPAWGATAGRLEVEQDSAVSIHAPRVGRDGASGERPPDDLVVSIHAPRVGRDPRPWACGPAGSFQFTRPAWGATAALGRGLEREEVSIHAPRVGRDARRGRATRRCLCFNSRAPRGARPHRQRTRRHPPSFNSRAPRGARRVQRVAKIPSSVSIHAPRVGRDFPP